MIVMLKGIIEAKFNDQCIIDVNGVCYGVHCSKRTMSMLPEKGGKANLLTEMIVREDSMQLFGFVDELEQLWFRTLTSVQGVGNKVALAILSIDDPENIHSAIYAGDKTFISRADGVGPKLATRIINELQDKVAKIFSQQIGLANSNNNDNNTNTNKTANDNDNNKKDISPVKESTNSIAHIRDAVSALSNLGYSESEAHNAVKNVINDKERINDKQQQSVDNLIIESLKILSK